MRTGKKKSLSLDDLDRKIIKELGVDARQSYLDLGKKLHASEGTIRYRLRLILKRGIIKLKAVLDPSILGFDFSCVMGIEIDIAKLSEAASILEKNPHVNFLSRCTGSFDIFSILIFRNTRDFDQFMDETISKLPGLKRTQTFVNMRVFKASWMSDMNIDQLLEP
jgi:DNA-binding Lrp family transcriptional regulator